MFKDLVNAVVDILVGLLVRVVIIAVIGVVSFKMSDAGIINDWAALYISIFTVAAAVATFCNRKEK